MKRLDGVDGLLLLVRSPRLAGYEATGELRDLVALVHDRTGDPVGPIPDVDVRNAEKLTESRQRQSVGFEELSKEKCAVCHGGSVNRFTPEVKEDCASINCQGGYVCLR